MRKDDGSSLPLFHHTPFIMQLLCHSVGIDMSADSFDTQVDNFYADRCSKKKAARKFRNVRSDFVKFERWLKRQAPNTELIHLCMEATGRYYEPLAYYLHEAGYQVSVVLPNKIKYFARSLNEYSKNDPLDASIIAAYTSLYKPAAWKPANKSMRQLRELTRERKQLTKMSTQAKNRLAALSAGHQPLKDTAKRLRKQIKFFEHQIEQIEQELDQLRAADLELERSYSLLTSIPFVGPITAYTFIAETGGFALFENRNQLIKYAGLDIIEKQSGTSVRGKSTISKRGNAHLRSVAFPGLGSISRGKTVFSQTYNNAISRGMEKKQARTAVVRQLLKVAYGVHKSGIPYDAEIHASRVKKQTGELEGSPAVTHLAN